MEPVGDEGLLAEHADLSSEEQEHLGRLDRLWSSSSPHPSPQGETPLPAGWRKHGLTVSQLPLFGVGFSFDGEQQVCVVRNCLFGITIGRRTVPFGETSIRLHVQPYRLSEVVADAPARAFAPLCYLVLTAPGTTERWLHFANKYASLDEIEAIAAALKSIGERIDTPVVHSRRPPDKGGSGLVGGPSA
jgi:hypothetical protein